MAVTLNASTTSGFVQSADTSGSITLQSNGTNIATISSTGLTMNSGNIVVASTAAPAFRANTSSSQSISSGTWTKVVYDTKEWDTNTNYSTANARFTPTVAGYYQISAGVFLNATRSFYVQIYKNGTDNTWLGISSTSTVREISGSSLIYFNGSTDYVEIYVYIESSGATLNGSSTQNWFTGALVRSA